MSVFLKRYELMARFWIDYNVQLSPVLIILFVFDTTIRNPLQHFSFTQSIKHRSIINTIAYPRSLAMMSDAPVHRTEYYSPIILKDNSIIALSVFIVLGYCKSGVTLTLCRTVGLSEIFHRQKIPEFILKVREFLSVFVVL